MALLQQNEIKPLSLKTAEKKNENKLVLPSSYLSDSVLSKHEVGIHSNFRAIG